MDVFTKIVLTALFWGALGLAIAWGAKRWKAYREAQAKGNEDELGS